MIKYDAETREFCAMDTRELNWELRSLIAETRADKLTVAVIWLADTLYNPRTGIDPRILAEGPLAWQDAS